MRSSCQSSSTPNGFFLRPVIGSARPVELPAQLRLDLGPFAGRQAVHHGVADRAVAAHRVVTQHAVAARAEALDRALALEIEVVGAPADQLGDEGLERMR